MDEGTEGGSEEANDLDFFKQHENLDSHQSETIIPTEEKAFLAPNVVPTDDNTEEKSASEIASKCLGPSVKLSDSISSAQAERKPTIGRRTAQTKRPGVSFGLAIKRQTAISSRDYVISSYLPLVARKEDREPGCSESQD